MPRYTYSTLQTATQPYNRQCCNKRVSTTTRHKRYSFQEERLQEELLQEGFFQDKLLQEELLLEELFLEKLLVLRR